MKNKKGVMEISIVLFVLATLILVITAIVLFHFKQKDLTLDTDVDSNISDVYFRADLLDFYLNNICNQLDVNSASKPADQFKTLLEKYKDGDRKYVFRDFSAVENQIDDKHIFKQNNVILVLFQVSLTDGPLINSGKYGWDARVIYNYDFSCKKEIIKPICTTCSSSSLPLGYGQSAS